MQHVSSRYFTRFIFIFFTMTLLILCDAGLTAPQNDKLKIIFSGSKKNPQTIAAITRNGLVYASLDDLAQALVFKPFYDNTRGKMELLLPAYKMKFTANNPYIVVAEINSSSISEVYQMPHEVLRTANGYYAPVSAFIPLLRRVWNHAIAFDRKSALLTISSGGNAPASSQQKDTTTAAPPIVEKKFDISHLSVETRKNGMLIRIHSKKNLSRFESALTPGGELIIHVAGATADIAEIEQTPTTFEFKKIEAKQAGDAVKFRFTLNTDVETSDITKDAQSNDLLVALYHKASVDSIYAAEMQVKKNIVDKKKSRWKLDVIIIDAGHGGKDPGTIGVTGVKEKNIALGIALKLGKLIETKIKNVRVVYTRSADRFIELDRRGQIANEEAGKLFISIHCNATEKKPSNAQGFEVYLLRPGRTDEAIRIAEVENSVIKLEKDYEKRYAQLTNENFILINMAQSSYMKYSERFAEVLHQQTEAEKFMKSHGVKQAGFLVLVGASMPGVLIETGFLSNAKEEKVLASQEGQRRIAATIFKAVERYSKEYDKSIHE